MNKASRLIWIGTSGWHYDHWTKRFYPEKLKKSDWLAFYMQHFNTVELNNTFYHLPKESSVQRWHELAEKNFIYTVKASRYITHIKRLKDVEESLQLLFDRISLLKENTGPILFQLPPNLHKDAKLLEDFIELLPEKILTVFEFRHASWYSDGIYELLDKAGCGFCVHDMQDKESPRIVTGKLIYVRFHGTTGRYSGNYSTKDLQGWAKWISDNVKSDLQVYAYFNNDYNAYAVKNAQKLKELLLS